MGWLRLVGCLQIYVSLQNIGLFCRSLLQKGPIFLSILLIVATPYHWQHSNIIDNVQTSLATFTYHWQHLNIHLNMYRGDQAWISGQFWSFLFIFLGQYLNIHLHIYLVVSKSEIQTLRFVFVCGNIQIFIYTFTGVPKSEFDFFLFLWAICKYSSTNLFRCFQVWIWGHTCCLRCTQWEFDVGLPSLSSSET